MKIKICGLTDEQNIDELLRVAKPDFMGFIFYKHSSRNVLNRLNPETSKKFPHKPSKTGVFVNSTERFVLKQAHDYRLTTLQFHGEESPGFCKHFKEMGYTIIKAFSISDSFDNSLMGTYSNTCDYFLFDTAGKNKGGNGKKFNWEILNQYFLDIPYFLSGGIDPEDAETIKKIQDPRLYGIDINSRFESKPGIKMPLTVRKFITALKK